MVPAESLRMPGFKQVLRCTECAELGMKKSVCVCIHQLWWSVNMIHRDRSQVQKTAKIKDLFLTHPCLSKEMKKKCMSINIIYWNLHRKTQKVMTQTSSLPSSVLVYKWPRLDGRKKVQACTRIFGLCPGGCWWSTSWVSCCVSVLNGLGDFSLL